MIQNEIQPVDESIKSSSGSESGSEDDNRIYIIIINKHDYHTEFPNKDIWTKNMKSFVHSYLKTHSPLYEDYISVPRYLIDAPFETPNVTLNNTINDSDTDYNEADYLVLDNVNINDESDRDEPDDVNNNDINYYIIRIDKKYDISCDEKEQKAFDDFDACEQQYEHTNELSVVAKFCSRLVLISYASAYLLMFSSLFINSNVPKISTNIKNNYSFTFDDEL